MTPAQQARAHALARGIAGMTADEGVRILAAELVELLGADTSKTSTIAMDARPDETPSEHPEAVRSRARRASRRQAVEQLELRASSVAQRSRPVATEHAPLSQDPDPPTLNKIRKGSPPAPAAYDPDRPPVFLLAMAPEIRGDLAEWDLRDMWRSFCRVISDRGFGHKDQRDLEQHLTNWLRTEDRQKRQSSREAYGAASTPPDEATAAPPPPPSSVEPFEHPDDIVVTPTPTQLARARLRSAPAAVLAGALRELPPDFEDFDALFPFIAPPRSMSA